MAGQSNMVGHGRIDKKTEQPPIVYRNGTLKWMVDTYPERYGKLETETNSWHVRNDVYITYNKQYRDDLIPEWNQYGPLQPGFGGDQKKYQDKMGPELGFGWTMGDAVLKWIHDDEDPKQENEDAYPSGSSPNILLLKVAWGGLSLAVDYRPPSSSSSSSTNQTTPGLYYEAMLANIYKTLANLTNLVPNYTKDNRGYELSGFVWHQGWNDGGEDIWVDEYEFNLANLINDVRIEFNKPDLPFVIGVSGMIGWKLDVNNNRNKLIKAQFAVSDPNKYPEFIDTVSSVETRDYYRNSTQSPGAQSYHWNNNCESYWLLGEAMAKAMIELLSPNSMPPSSLPVQSPTPAPVSQPTPSPINPPGCPKNSKEVVYVNTKGKKKKCNWVKTGKTLKIRRMRCKSKKYSYLGKRIKENCPKACGKYAGKGICKNLFLENCTGKTKYCGEEITI